MAHPTVTYKTFDRRDHLAAPQYTRAKQRYRGPRESRKVNLEIDQLLHSLKRLDELYSHFQEEFEDIGSTFLNGGELPGIVNNGETVVVDGLNDIAAKVEQLYIRIGNLRESSEALGRFTETFQSRL